MVNALLILLLIIVFIVIYLVIFNKLCYQNIPQMIEKFNLKENGFYDNRFKEILRAFLTGNNTALSQMRSMNEVRQHLDKEFTAFYRGFAYEGAGMGLAARANLFPLFKGNKFESHIQQLDSNHVYQYYVGLGWWLHARYAFRTAGYKSWMKQLDPRYAPILFDGVGFKTGLFNYADQPKCIERFTAFDYNFQRICYQGFGRSLWFIKEFQFDRVLLEMEKLPITHLKDIYSGIGLAVAYSIFDNITVAFNAFNQVPQAFQTAFAQGIVFGWEARRLQNYAYWQLMLNECTPFVRDKVETWIDTVYKARECVGDYAPETYYIRWMDVTRTMLHSIIPGRAMYETIQIS